VDWCGSGQWPVAGSCEHSDKPSSSGAMKLVSRVKTRSSFLCSFLQAPVTVSPYVQILPWVRRSERHSIFVFPFTERTQCVCTDFYRSPWSTQESDNCSCRHMQAKCEIISLISTFRMGLLYVITTSALTISTVSVFIL
jgi:hypothetical protein